MENHIYGLSLEARMGMRNSEVLREKSILVTGGAGFIGSHLVDKLLELQCQVIVLDDLSSGRFDNLPINSRLSFVHGDVRNLRLVTKITEDIDIIFHLAEFIPNTNQFGPGHVIKFSSQNPFLDLDICVKGTLSILEAARRNDAGVLFTSSAAVYGEPNANPVKETAIPRPISPYGASKLSAETYCSLYYRTYGLRTSIARLFNVFGPRQRKYIMYDIMSKLSMNPNSLNMLGSGEEERDFIYVSDVAESLIFLGTRDNTTGEIFNIGTGRSTSVRDVVASVTKMLDAKPVVVYAGDSWKGDIKKIVSDPTKLNSVGFVPKHNLSSGLEEFVRWYLQNDFGSDLTPKT